ncbi:hypothetical protein OGAPHI_007271 [Ogataea philodendri]|uniref:Uncharacterized protein n=1 Tax=Ogataea philodendri TaxID=1378263 RepID=A0A9P8SZZ6_9ASCO|nr:uncharacterized protein OGAPHI_007271 [Ogataea philodendri]KAH3660066.1 hypothetical protein OGAPHI_007271 [Ogataea philodendri]
MPVFESPAVYVQSTLTTLATYFISHAYLREMLDVHVTDANFLPLSAPNRAFHIRRDNDRRQVLVNVFNEKGEKVYIFQRESALNPTWSLRTLPSYKEVATIRCGFFLKSLDFHNKPGLQHRVINSESGWSGRLRTFYLTDGHKYGWTRNSKYLEKFTNPGGNDEEVRERVAKVRLMRQRKFDYELTLDDTKVDPEVAMATAFVAMMTFWGLGDITETVGPTALVKKEEEVVAPVAAPVAPAAPKAEVERSGPNITLVMDADNDADLIIEKA